MLEHYIYFHSGVAASLDFVYWSNHSRMVVHNVNTTARAELYESGIDPSSFISKRGCEYSGLILTNLVRDELVVVAVIVAVVRH